MLADVHDGYLDAAQAEADYGVVLSADGRAVDEAATDACRRSRRERQA